MSGYDIEHERQRFDQWAETYEHSFMQWLIFDRVHRAILRRLPGGFTPQRLLDIGCGTGRLLRRMHARWPQAALIGVDPSDGMLTRACQLTPAATLYQATAERLPLEDAWTDLVTTTMSFHHWDDQVQGVREVYRVLRSEGLFALADTNIGHGHPLSRAAVRDLFSSAGFSIYSQTSVVPFLTVTIGEKG